MPKSKPLPYQPPLVQTAVKQIIPDLKLDPTRHSPTTAPGPCSRISADGSCARWPGKIGLNRLGIAYHNSAVALCPNGDLIAAYYNTPKLKRMIPIRPS